MADLTQALSTWATGTQDTASTLVELVDEKRAAHINGPNSAIVGMQAKLGSATTLVGTRSTLAERLSYGLTAAGYGMSAEPGDLCLSGRSSKTGWLLCDGSAVSRATYSDLYNAIGTTFGAGDGSTTFNLPPAGRLIMIAGAGVGDGSSGTGAPSGSALTTRALASWGGKERVLLTEAESGLRGHFHQISVAGATGGTARSAHSGDSEVAQVNSQSVSGQDALASHENMPPFVAFNLFIKT
jgi:microcystin-dependent protein